jgi:hypothetical protein
MRSPLICSPLLPAILAFPIALSGCDGADGSSGPGGGGEGGAAACQLEYIGDKDAPIEMEIVTLNPDYQAVPFEDGDDASILFPPQGGRVIFVGVRAKNLDPCSVRLTGALRDPATSKVMLDKRTVILDPTEDGWGTSDPTEISSFSNIPVCPNSWASTDVFDQSFTLEITLTDRNGKEAKLDPPRSVVPRCDETKIVDAQDLQKQCQCICKQGYITGEMCQ